MSSTIIDQAIRNGLHVFADDPVGVWIDTQEAHVIRLHMQDHEVHRIKQNMARHRNSPHMPFWKMLKTGYDHFEVTRQEPRVDVCDKRYVFNAIPFDPAEGFNPQRSCPVYDQPVEVVEAVHQGEPHRRLPAGGHAGAGARR